MEHRCELVERPAQGALVIRTRTPAERLPGVVGQAYGAVMAYAGQAGFVPSGPPFVAYFNMDMADLDLEIGFPFEGRPAGQGDVRASEIPGGQAVTCLHVGPYPELVGAYGALDAWLQAEGREAEGAAYEFYLNDPQTTPPAELQTLVIFPLK